jgi:CRP/FNR family cyclic AMP-dependent transcriptional regulator
MSTESVTRLTFLELLDDSDRAALHTIGRTISAPRGSVLMYQGEPGDRVMILLAGHAKVTRVTESGNETLLGICDPGDLLGELAHIDGRVRAATVTALQQVEVLAIASSVFRAEVKRAPGVDTALLQVLAARFREATRWSAHMCHCDTLGRLAARLTELADRYGQPTDSGLTISLPLSQQELTEWTAGSRAGVAKALQTLRHLGWIETRRRGILVRNIQTLRARAHQTPGPPDRTPPTRPDPEALRRGDLTTPAPGGLR